jgi:hypothetical protein
MAKAKKAAEMVPGFDGAEMITTRVKITATRWEGRPLRCRPGTFEWRYGRENADSSLYHAGIHFATLWEKAGTAAASSPDLGREGTGQWKGIPVTRLEAMQKIDAARQDVGKWGAARLVDYCVMGTPAPEIARKYKTDERAMAFILEADLKACAVHFGYL